MQTVIDERQQQYAPPAPKPGYEICKRIFDVLMSALALIILSPLFLITAVAVWL
jgi:lipopolysaccharide/colanic/teichoic acid biosynthesis glycosyltransferase